MSSHESSFSDPWIITSFFRIPHNLFSYSLLDCEFFFSKSDTQRKQLLTSWNKPTNCQKQNDQNFECLSSFLITVFHFGHSGLSAYGPSFFLVIKRLVFATWLEWQKQTSWTNIHTVNLSMNWKEQTSHALSIPIYPWRGPPSTLWSLKS